MRQWRSSMRRSQADPVAEKLTLLTLFAPASERVELVDDWQECRRHERRWLKTFTSGARTLEAVGVDTRDWERIVVRAGARGFSGALARSAFVQALARDRARRDSDLVAAVCLGEPPLCVAWNATRLICRRLLQHWDGPICVTRLDYRWCFLQLVSPYRQQFFLVSDTRDEV